MLRFVGVLLQYDGGRDGCRDCRSRCCDDGAWCCAVVLFRVRVVVLSAFVVGTAGGAADLLLSLLKAQL